MPLTRETFAAVVLEDIDGRWELHQGKLREKPQMSFAHNRLARRLAFRIASQLDLDRFEVLHDDGHLSVPLGSSYVPDVAVVPNELFEAFSNAPDRFESYTGSLPFVAEGWSPSTGSYDVDTKIPGYKARGDEEIWRIHPFERTLSMARLQPDGAYEATVVTGGTVRLHALSEVIIDLDEMFSRE